jgi:hypothetical protein
MMITYTGRMIDPLAPTVADISIMDIAHALAYTSRYNGHGAEFYSVAQHCFILSHIVPRHAALWALLHDAAEAYVGDVIGPIKELPEMAGYREMEAQFMAVIATRFGLGLLITPELREPDLRIRLDEMRALRLHSPAAGTKPLGVPILPCWSPREAESNFMCRFDELYAGAL